MNDSIMQKMVSNSSELEVKGGDFNSVMINDDGLIWIIDDFPLGGHSRTSSRLERRS